MPQLRQTVVKPGRDDRNRDASQHIRYQGLHCASDQNKAMLPNKWRIDEKKYLGIASSQIKPYINEVEKNVRKTHKNFTIYKHELELLEFEEIEGDYKVTSTVKIWVVV